MTGSLGHEAWHEWLHAELPPPSLPDDAPEVIDLFAGCGGLSLPFEACGFRSIGCEMGPVAAGVNDGRRGHSVTLEVLDVLRSYDGPEREERLLFFRSNVGDLKDRLSKAREFQMVPVTLPDGSEYRLSPGPHNRIQKAVIEDFLPRFSKGAEVLYIGDTAKKILHMDADRMKAIGLAEMDRDMLPDILAHEEERNWLFLVEAVHSSNPVSQLRHMALQRLTENSTPGCLFVSAFADAATFAKFSKQIGWETDVWIADDPEHMIHFDGGRFLAPYDNQD